MGVPFDGVARGPRDGVQEVACGMGFGALPTGHQPRGEHGGPGCAAARHEVGRWQGTVPAGDDGAGLSSRTFARCRVRCDNTARRRRTLRAGPVRRRGTGSCRSSWARGTRGRQSRRAKVHDVDTLLVTSRSVDRVAGRKGPLAHPPELTYPCCLPALGEFGEMMPHEGSGPSLAQDRAPPETGPDGCRRTGPTARRTPREPDDSVQAARSGILVALPRSMITIGGAPGGFA